MMGKRAPLDNPNRGLSSAATDRLEQQRQLESCVESRLTDVGEIVARVVGAPYPSLLQDKDAIRQTLEKLAVRETALRWIVRVAKHSEGTVRDALWLRIQDTLPGLEKTAEALMRGERVEYEP
jgi:hypothetical protein